jgi:hypothetical protein
VSANFAELIQARAKLLHEHVQASTGCIVVAGPFRGMRLIPDISWGGGDVAAKLLGHYEAELHPVIERLVTAGFDQIINIGCAEGFYAIGMAMRCPTAHIFAFDTDVIAQRVCSANCAANGVQDRINVGGAVDPDLLKALTIDVANRLFIVDCEGYEAVLVEPERVPGLKQATLLIECHDFVDRSITNTLTRRLAPTHYLGLIGEGGRDPNQSPLLKPFNSFDRWLALCEFRPETMHWLLASPKLDKD